MCCTHISLIWVHNMTHSYMFDSFVCATWRIHMCCTHRASSPFIYVTRLICMRNMTHSHGCTHIFKYICGEFTLERCGELEGYSTFSGNCHIWLEIFVKHMLHSREWRDLFTCVTWLIHMCTLTERNSLMFVTFFINVLQCGAECCRVLQCADVLVDMCDVMHAYVCTYQQHTAT